MQFHNRSGGGGGNPLLKRRDGAQDRTGIAGTIMLINMDYYKNGGKSYNTKTTITILFSFISYP